MTFSYVLTIIDFGSSWIDGKVFCAILIQSGFLQDYDWAEICQMSVESRLRVAFETAELRLKVPSILDIDDLLLEPDSKSIQLYVSYLYKAVGTQIDMRTSVDAIQAVIKLRDRAARSKNMEKVDETIALIKGEIDELSQLEQAIAKTTLDRAEKDRDAIEAKKTKVESLKLIVNDFQRNYKNDSIERLVQVFAQLRTVVGLFWLVQKYNWWINVNYHLVRMADICRPTMISQVLSSIETKLQNIIIELKQDCLRKWQDECSSHEDLLNSIAAKQIPFEPEETNTLLDMLSQCNSALLDMLGRLPSETDLSNDQVESVTESINLGKSKVEVNQWANLCATWFAAKKYKLV